MSMKLTRKFDIDKHAQRETSENYNNNFRQRKRHTDNDKFCVRKMYKHCLKNV